MSQVGTLYAYDSYTYEMKLYLDFRANLFDIIGRLSCYIARNNAFSLLMLDETGEVLSEDEQYQI